MTDVDGNSEGATQEPPDGLFEALTDLDSKSKQHQFETVTKELDRAVRKARWAAWVTFASAGTFAGVSVFKTLPDLNSAAIKAIQDNQDSLYVFIYELARTTAGAAVVTAILWGLFNLAKASLDQATRYEKRLIAAQFLHYTLETSKPEVKSGKIHLGDIMQFLKAWSENVESAYTSVKFGTKGRDAFALTASTAGVSLTTGKGLNPPAPVQAEPA